MLSCNSLLFKTVSLECRTKGGKVSNELCVFPFIYKDVEFSTCTDTNHDAQWCATKTDEEGKFINDEWGNCDVGCPGFRGIKTYFMSKYGYADLNYQ